MLRLIHYISVFPLFILLFSCAGRVVEEDKASTYFEKGVAFEDKNMLWGLTIIGLLCCFLKAI